MSQAESNTSTAAPGPAPAADVSSRNVGDASSANQSRFDRRSVLNMLSTATLVPVATVAGPSLAGTIQVEAKSAAPSESDAQLVELANKVLALIPAYGDALNLEADAEEKYADFQPAYPAVLRHLTGDIVPRSNIEPPYCDFDAIEKLRGKEFFYYEFTGTAAERVEMDLPYPALQSPPSGLAHLFKATSDRRKQKRAQELLRALDEVEATKAVARRKSGFEAAEQHTNAIQDEIDQCIERMTTLRASSFSGLHAKGVVLQQWCWRNIKDLSPDELANELMMSLMSDIGAKGPLPAVA